MSNNFHMDLSIWTLKIKMLSKRKNGIFFCLEFQISNAVVCQPNFEKLVFLSREHHSIRYRYQKTHSERKRRETEEMIINILIKCQSDINKISNFKGGNVIQPGWGVVWGANLRKHLAEHQRPLNRWKSFINLYNATWNLNKVERIIMM